MASLHPRGYLRQFEVCALVYCRNAPSLENDLNTFLRNVIYGARIPVPRILSRGGCGGQFLEILGPIRGREEEEEKKRKDKTPLRRIKEGCNDFPHARPIFGWRKKKAKKKSGWQRRDPLLLPATTQSFSYNLGPGLRPPKRPKGFTHSRRIINQLPKIG